MYRVNTEKFLNIAEKIIKESAISQEDFFFEFEKFMTSILQKKDIIDVYQRRKYMSDENWDLYKEKFYEEMNIE